MLPPKPGERYEHLDGGTVYIIGRKKRLIRIQRRPFGDSQADPKWIRLPTFHKITREKLGL